jgi:nucleotide-binding universal stress UspA family protein
MPNPPLPADRPWLIAHDFSQCADAAANLALTDLLSMRRPPSVVLFSVYSLPVPVATPLGAVPPTDEKALRASVRRALETVAERLRGRWLEETGDEAPVHIDVAIACGTAADAILDEATRINAARIFVGTHGRKGLSRLVLGSVAERVLRTATVPVIVVHAAVAVAEERAA